jgi:hypothetical protein
MHNHGALWQQSGDIRSQRNLTRSVKRRRVIPWSYCCGAGVSAGFAAKRKKFDDGKGTLQ